MSIINIDNNRIPLSAYLRADPHSQIYMANNNDGKRDSLVSLEMFWGDENNDPIYLDYTNVIGRNITISTGISENCQSQIHRERHCDEWIESHLLENVMSKLYVIRGYAGCGKTTFINHLIYKKNKKTNIIYTDIGENWSYSAEPYMFFSRALNEVDKCIDHISNDKSRNKIWEEFIHLGTDTNINYLNQELPNVIAKLITIKNKSTWNNLKTNIHHYLYSSYSERDNQSSKYNSVNGKHIVWHNVGQTEVIVSVLILLICAQCTINQTDIKGSMLVFDNLDVITNPAIPSENVVSMWAVINSYNKFRNHYEEKHSKTLQNFSIIIAVRKVLYSHIVSHLPDLEMIVNYDAFYVNVCDISNLYLSQYILEHRINYWQKHINDEETIKKLLHLSQIRTVVSNTDELLVEDEYEIQRSINLDALFNHNYRAFSNMLSAFFDNETYYVKLIPDFGKTSLSHEWQKVATLIFVISLFYRNKKVWNELGFGCRDFNTIDYPTTFNRLILNFLYVAKRGQELRHIAPERNDIPFENEVSLQKLVDTFNKVKLMLGSVTLNEEQLRLKYQTSNDTNTTDLLFDRLSKMCARNSRIINSKAYGYDSDSDELWRRPLFFTGGIKLNHTAASDIELKNFFDEALKNDAEKVKFSITDEGFILIKDIVANFEFYSARYCDETQAKPLHQATTSEEIDMLISPVYSAIKLCCSRHDLFMKEYVNNYKISKNSYLKAYFHPRTNPRYSNNNGIRELEEFSFRPQLHIVRVIYSHISYFEEVKKIHKHNSDETSKRICDALTNWIKKYLLLYKNNFYQNLIDTVCHSDNNVYNELIKRFQEQEKTTLND